MAQTAINKQTGERLELKNGVWVPVSEDAGNSNIAVGRTAINKQTGERITWSGKEWVPVVEQQKPTNPIGIAEGGFRQGLADVVSLPNTLGQMMMGAAKPAGMGQLAPGDPLEKIYGTAQQRTDIGGAIAANTPSREELLARAERNVGPMMEPQETSGRLLQSGVRAATSGIPFGPAGIAAGGISGTAGQFAAEQGAPPWVQVVASVGVPITAAGLLAAGRSALTGTAAATWKSAMKDLPRNQFEQAALLHKTSIDLGAPITPAEAIAAVTNRAGSAQVLLKLQRIVEGSSGGQLPMGNFMAQRTPANEAMMARLEQQLGGRVGGQQLSETPQQMQQAAEGALGNIRGAATAQSQPYYQAANPVTVPRQEMDNLITSLDDTISKTGANASQNQLKAFRADLIDAAGVPKQDIQRLDSILKSWRGKIELPAVSAEALDKEVASKIGGLLKNLDKTMKSASPDYETAKLVSGTMARNVTGPSERTGLGAIASEKTPSLAGQKTELMPRAPEGLDENTVRFMIGQLRKQNPDAVKRFTTAALRSEFDKANRVLKVGNEYGGASFAQNLIGNSQQAKNIEALIREAYGDAEYIGFRRMINVLQAQGTRQAPGSLTAENIEAIKGLSGGRLPISISKPLRGWQEWVDRVKYGYNTNKLAELMTDPNAMDKLRQLAMTEVGSARERFLVGTIIGAEPDEQQQRNLGGGLR